MKASNNIITVIFKQMAALLLLIVLQSCGTTYNTKTADIENDLLNGNYENALVNIDQNKFLLKDRNRLLYLMEKGKLEHLRGNYEVSNALLEEAYIMVDDRIRTNAGQAVAAKFTNPMAEPYKGEDFEKVTIYYYKALNYFYLGMPNEALVEAKRINIKLNELNENYKENKNKYSEDAFSQILQGIIYESIGDVNNAFIAYRNAEAIFSRNDGRFFGVEIPNQLKKDLVRTARLMGFTQEYDLYRKKFNLEPDPEPAKNTKKGKKSAPAKAEPKIVKPEPTGEAIVFWENGLGPAKDQIVITAAGGAGIFYGSYQDDDGFQEIIIPIPPGVNIGNINAIAIPKYRKRYSYYSKASILVNGNEEPLELAQDFYPIAKQCLKDRMLRETIDLAARFATKKATSAGLGLLADNLIGDGAGDIVKLGADAAGAATEQADTRNWQSLPSTISYARLPLNEGENKFLIKKYGPEGIDTDTITIAYKKGLQIVNYSDLGRTQLLPANHQQALTDNATALNAKTQTTFAQNTVSVQKVPDVPASKSIAVPSGNYKAADNSVTVKTVINNYITASGGEKNIKAVKTTYQRIVTRSEFNGVASTTEMLIKTNANSDMFMETYTGGKRTSTFVKNSSGSYILDEKGKRTKLPATAETNVNQYDAYTSLLRNDTAKLEGITTVNGIEAYAISYRLPETEATMINYYSTKDALLVATETNQVISNVNYNTKNYFSDYRDVNGVLYPFKTRTVSSGLSGESETTFLEFKINDGVTDADFQ